MLRRKFSQREERRREGGKDALEVVEREVGSTHGGDDVRASEVCVRVRPGWSRAETGRGRTGVGVRALGLQCDGLFPGGNRVIVLLLTSQHPRRR